MFHSFFNSLARSRYLSFFSLSFKFILWSAGTAKILFLLLIIMRFGLLAGIRWSVCMLKSHRSLWESFSRTGAGLCIYPFIIIIISIIVILSLLLLLFTPWEFFTSVLADGLFHSSLSDSESPKVSRTFLSILAGLNNVVVWVVSTRPPTPMSSCPFNNPFVTVLKAPIAIGIMVTFIFHSFFNSLARSR